MPDYKPTNLGTTSCGRSIFHWGKRTYIMGVTNVSPDSFSGDGLADVEEAVARAERLASEGADIIDIGGESTRPASTPISTDEELRRVIPVVEKLAHNIPLPLSVDTYKLEVAREALNAGADMINDIWGLKKEPRLAELAAQKSVPIVLMSNQRSSPCRDIMSAVILEGTAATIAIGISKGADIVRVHDVKEMARVCKMSDALVRGV